MADTYYVYILQNPQGRRYIGVSDDPDHRLVQHNTGESKWTAKFRPWQRIWLSRPMPLSNARRLENLMKRQKGGSGLQILMRDFSLHTDEHGS